MTGAPFSVGDEIAVETVGKCVVVACFNGLVGGWRVIAKDERGSYNLPLSMARANV